MTAGRPAGSWGAPAAARTQPPRPLRENATALAVTWAISLAVPVTALASEHLPNLNVEQGCRTVAASLSLPEDRQTNFQSCMRQETSSRAALASQWSSFREGDRQSCLAQTDADGTPSYVELLECVTLARDARKWDQQLPPAQR